MKVITLVLESGITGAFAVFILAISYKIYKSRCHERFQKDGLILELESRN